jgi:predicted DNA-binding WGR domain protein
MIHLTRTDPAHNMARFYALHLAPTLFGEWSLVREWGRIGQGGTVRQELFAGRAEAEQAFVRILEHKRRRGYAASLDATPADIFRAGP